MYSIEWYKLKGDTLTYNTLMAWDADKTTIETRIAEDSRVIKNFGTLHIRVSNRTFSPGDEIVVRKAVGDPMILYNNNPMSGYPEYNVDYVRTQSQDQVLKMFIAREQDPYRRRRYDDPKELERLLKEAASRAEFPYQCIYGELPYTRKPYLHPQTAKNDDDIERQDNE
jgi:hypothetical protein